MKNNRIYFGLLILVLLLIVGWASVNMLNVGKEEESYSVSVIVSDSNNDRWISMREGLNQAARDNHINLNYVSTGKIGSAEEEMTLINREIENGADGIIVQMVYADMDSEYMEALDARTVVMLIESDVKPEDLYTITGPDNTEIGKTIAEEIKVDFGERLAGKRINVLIGNQNQNSMQQRLSGFLETMQGTGAEIFQNALTEQPPDILVALGNTETEDAVDYLLTMSQEIDSDYYLYGVGCSEKAVYYLDKGLIQTLVVPNEFNMGYQSMDAVARQLQYRLSEAKNQQIEYLVIDRTNLYDEENQKILFPIVQ